MYLLFFRGEDEEKPMTIIAIATPKHEEEMARENRSMIQTFQLATDRNQDSIDNKARRETNVSRVVSAAIKISLIPAVMRARLSARNARVISAQPT